MLPANRASVAVMKAQVIFDERRNEIVAMVVAFVITKRQRLADVSARRLERRRIQLFAQEWVGQPLVNQQAVRKRRR